jgi:hypothetical protein
MKALNLSSSILVYVPSRTESTDGQWRVARLDDVHEGFNIGSEIERVFIDPLVIEDVGF